jgi:hypothetical protein
VHRSTIISLTQAGNHKHKKRAGRRVPLLEIRQAGAQPSSNVRIGADEIAGDPAEQSRTGPNEGWKTVEQGSRSVDPKTMNGIDKARPRRIKSLEPFAAAATAIILSSDITVSATMMMRMADRSVLAGLISFSEVPSPTSRIAIHSNRMPPPTFSKGSASNSTTRSVQRMRNATAAPDPRKTSTLRCPSGSDRHASAMTTALSLERRISIQIISRSGSQKAVVLRSIAWS